MRVHDSIEAGATSESPSARTAQLRRPDPRRAPEKRGRALEVDVDGPLTLGESELMMRAALDGVGLALAFEGHVEALIAQGRLVRVLEDWCPTFPGFHLYYPSRRQLPAGLRAFIEMLRER